MGGLTNLYYPRFYNLCFIVCGAMYSGAHTYKSLFLPDAPMPSPVVLAVSKLKDDTPAYFRIHKDAPGRLVTGPVLTHANLLADKHWYFANKFASQEYFECDI
jgi:hypothetical protein